MRVQVDKQGAQFNNRDRRRCTGWIRQVDLPRFVKQAAMVLDAGSSSFGPTLRRTYERRLTASPPVR
jgi:hypothetical protein